MALPFGSGPLWAGKPQGVPPDPSRIAAPGYGATPYVGNYGSSYVATGTTMSFGTNIRQGNGAFVFLMTAGTSPKCTDNQGNTYNFRGTLTVTSNTNLVSAFWVPRTLGGNPTITVTWSGGSNHTLAIWAEVVGANPGWFVDTSATVISTGSTAQPVLSTYSQNDLIVTMVGSPSGTATLPAGYTARNYKDTFSNVVALGFSNAPQPAGTIGPQWGGVSAAGGSAFTFAVRAAGQYPDHAPLKGKYSPLPPWTPYIVPPVRNEAGAVPAPGANNYTLSAAFVSYSQPIQNIAQQIALNVPKIGYTHRPQAVTLDTADVAGFVPYTLNIQSVTLTYASAANNYSLNLDFIPFAHVAEGMTFQAPNTEVQAGRNLRAVQYIFTIDGKEFATPSLQQAVDLLNQAKDLARRHALEVARAATEKSPQAPKIKLPRITGSGPVKELVLEVRKEIKAIYESALRDAEISMLMELQKRADEEEDTWLMLL